MQKFIYNKTDESKVPKSSTTQMLMYLLHEKNEREEQHSERVSKLCREIGKKLALNQNEISILTVIGLLHDIGKIYIDNRILNKTGKLTEDEWNKLKEHPAIGYKILKSYPDTYDLAKFVLYHHEHYDGTGYPAGLKGDDIPFFSRIITVADSYDAMTSERPYKKAMEKNAAINELINNRGIQFDPLILDILIDKILRHT